MNLAGVDDELNFENFAELWLAVDQDNGSMRVRDALVAQVRLFKLGFDHLDRDKSGIALT